MCQRLLAAVFMDALWCLLPTLPRAAINDNPSHWRLLHELRKVLIRHIAACMGLAGMDVISLPLWRMVQMNKIEQGQCVSFQA